MNLQAIYMNFLRILTPEEQKILQGIVTFGNTDAKQVMKPRMDIFALSNDQKFSDILPDIISNGYSRIPVYKENIDNITGVLYVKDLLPFLDRKKLDWVSLQREAYFVPENKKLDDLLDEFKEMKMHLAIVVDEYGGMSGILTLEDVLAYSSLTGNWGQFNYFAYVQLVPSANYFEVVNKIKSTVVEFGDDREMRFEELTLQPIQDVHFQASDGNVKASYDTRYLFIYVSIALAIFIISCSGNKPEPVQL